MAKTTSFQEFFTKFAPVTKRLQLDPYFKDQTTSLGVYFEPIKKKKFEKIFLVNAFANGLISVLLNTQYFAHTKKEEKVVTTNYLIRLSALLSFSAKETFVNHMDSKWLSL